MPENSMNRVRSKSVDGTLKLKGLQSRNSTQSFSIMSIDNVMPVAGSNDDENQILLARKMSQEKRAHSPPLVSSEEKK